MATTSTERKQSLPRYLYWLALASMRLGLQKLFLKLPEKEQDELVAPIYGHLKRILQARDENPEIYYETFRWLEARGVHFTPNHYYYPIPDTSELAARSEQFAQPSAMVGIDLAVERQLHYVNEIFPRFADEYNRLPLGKSPDLPAYAFYLNNGIFDGLDALVLYCMVRHFKPNRILEVGSGWSSRLSAHAALVNGHHASDVYRTVPRQTTAGGLSRIGRADRQESGRGGNNPIRRAW